MTTSRRIDIPLHLINAVVTAVSISIIVLLLVPTTMKRAGSSTMYNPRNRTWTDDSPMTEMVQWIFFVRSVPDARIDVNDEELNEFWFLPPNTRLSPLMKSIGRCRMAVEMRKKGGVDADQCNVGTGVWYWTMMVATIIQLVLCHRRAVEIVNSPSRIVVEIARSKLVMLVLTVASSVNWCVVCVAFLIDHHSLGDDPTGIVYTLENEIEPIAYYSPSWSHGALEWLNVSMMITLLAELVVAWLTCWWIVRARGVALGVCFIAFWQRADGSPASKRPHEISSSSSMMFVGGFIFILCVVLAVLLCGGDDKHQKKKDKAFEEAPPPPTADGKQPEPMPPPQPQQPQQPQHPQQPQQQAEPPHQPSFQLDGNSVKSLIVPKSTDRTVSLTSRATRKSFTSSSAATGKELLKSVKNEPPPKKGGKGKKKNSGV